MTACTKTENTEKSITAVTVSSMAQKNETSDFYGLWNGSIITAETAEKNNCLYTVDGVADKHTVWDEFCAKVACWQNCNVIIYNGESLRKVIFTNDDGDMRFTVLTKAISNCVLIENKRTISPGVICNVKNDDMTEYYISDILLCKYKALADGKYGTDTDFVGKMYQVSPDANITFPYQKTFTGLDDYEKYSKKYNDELKLDDLSKDMESFDEDGGFNAHVVFLYGDMAGSQEVEYEFLRTVRTDGNLFIYMKKAVPRDKKASVAKWQFTVTVAGELLDEVNPDSINWVIYEDTEK